MLATVDPLLPLSLLEAVRTVDRPADLAETVFRAAGRFVAREAYRTISPVRRNFMRVMPTLLARPLALGSMRRIGKRYFSGTVRRVGASLLLEVPRSITVDAAPASCGCIYYEAALGELLRLLIGSVGAVEHVHCAGRGEGTCEWRADWHAIDKSALRDSD